MPDNRDRSASGPQTTRSYDDRPFTFDGDTSTVSGKVKHIPDLPIVALAEDSVELRVLPKGAPAEAPKVVTEKAEWQRWNDYGIGLFLQGDLKGAAAAFLHVTEADPSNPDGWVNLGRVAVQEGDMERARVVLQRALSLNPDLARTNFFYARVLRTDGDYDGALCNICRKRRRNIPRTAWCATRWGGFCFCSTSTATPWCSCARPWPSIPKTCRPITT